MASPPTVTVTSHKSNQPTNGSGKNNSETTIVGGGQHGNPAAMNSYEFNRIHSSVGTGGNGESGMLVQMPQQQKNSLNKTSSNGDKLQGIRHIFCKSIFITSF